MFSHYSNCAIFDIEPGLRSPSDCTCHKHDQDIEDAKLEGFQRGLEARENQVEKLNKLEEALAWYADPEGYTEEGVKTDGGAFGWNHPDRGAHARAVLSMI